MAKIFMIILAIFVAGCVPHPSSEIRHGTKSELDEIYPITGIPFPEFESLLRNIKEHIPPNAAILSIGLAKHNNVAHVITGTIVGPLGGSGVTFVFEKIENNWRFVKKSIWIS